MLPVIQRSFDSSFDVFRELDRLVTSTACEVNRRVVGFPFDVYEVEDALVVEAELPGFGKDQVDVSIEDSVLTITAKAEATTEPTDDALEAESSVPETQSVIKNHIRERRQATRVRRLTVPATFDVTKVDAVLTDGMLTLSLPKREEVKPKQVEIR